MKQRGFFTERAIAWIVAIAVSAAVWAVAIHAFHTWRDGLIESGREEVRVAWRAAVDQANAQLLAERKAKDETESEVSRVQALHLARLADDAARSHAAGDRLQQRFDALVAARSHPAEGEGTAGRGEGVESAGADDLLSRLFAGVDGAAGDLAEYADRLRTAGESCERRYAIEVTP